MKIKLLIISILVILLCSGGCDFWKKSHVTVPTLTTSKDISISVDKINKNSKEIKEKTKNIKESSEEIKNSVYKIDDKIDNNVKEKIDIHLKSIKDGSNSIIANAGSIDNNVANITSSTSAIKESNILSRSVGFARIISQYGCINFLKVKVTNNVVLYFFI